MKLFRLFIVAWLSTFPFTGRLLAAPADSLLSKEDTVQRARANLFYDALRQRFNKPGLKGMVVKSIISPGKKNGSAEHSLVKEKKYYEAFKGLTIREVSIIRSNVYNDVDSLTGVRKLLHNWHWLSTEQTIRRYLLIKKGKVIDPDLMVRNEQLLRTLPFLQDAYIVLQQIGDKEADVYIYTHDNLSLSPAFTSEGIRRYYVSVAENNLRGTGSKLEFGSYLSSEKPMYRGYRGDFKAFNLYGTFFDFDLLAYKDYTISDYQTSLDKSFLLPTDYAGGLSFERKRYNDYQRIGDTTVLIVNHIWNIWGGKSFRVSPKFGSLYAGLRCFDSYYPNRYDVNPAFNLKFHNVKGLFLTTGIYKEDFYRGNLIYGFGKSEDIPYGFKLEFTGGMSNDEYDTLRTYVAGRLQFAQKTRFGYLNEDLQMGTYYNTHTGRYENSVLSANTNYFTNLISIGKWGLRNFFTARYMYGFNRTVGEGEKLTFNSENTPRAIRLTSMSHIMGYRRLVTNLESVAFSPLYVYGFRFALYGFWDYAWIGYNRNIFKNDSYTTVGLGIRVKNERLIFQTIQLRFGVALKKPPGAEMDWINVSELQRMNSTRIIPGKPAEIEYR
ncbi:hypothetical protein [Parabacteroides sp. FAFU027]|uniref:hypothetical protein n=1 Tax=Parabacteroides sp. FAFU027 TaxID=2922715 RepID=UPI001FAF6B73|nr:hypothetical protein [Parabacteroides sp. FAFU027]